MSNREFYKTSAFGFGETRAFGEKLEAHTENFIDLCKTGCIEDIEEYYLNYTRYITCYSYMHAICVAYDKQLTNVLDWLLDTNQMMYIGTDFTYEWLLNHYLIDKRNDVFRWNVEWLHRNHIKYNTQQCLELCCHYGQQYVAEFLVSNYEINDSYKPLSIVCATGNIEFATWLTSKFELTYDSVAIYKVFRSACNSYNMAIWFYDKYSTFVESLPLNKLNDIFCGTLTKNTLDVAVWLYSLYPGLTASDDAFRYACASGLTKNVSWMLEHFPTIDVLACDCYAFVSSCSRSYIDIVDILLSKEPMVMENKSVRRCLEQEIVNGNSEIIRLCKNHNITYTIHTKYNGALSYKVVEFA